MMVQVKPMEIWGMQGTGTILITMLSSHTWPDTSQMDSLDNVVVD